MTDRWTRFSDCRRSRTAPWLVALATAAAVTAGAASGLAQARPPATATVVTPATATVVTPAAHAALTPAAFAGVLMRLQRKSFGDEQLGLVRNSMARGDYFTCTQAGQLMRVAVASDDQVKIAAALYPHVVDPENFAQLIALLPLASDRQALRSLVSR